MVGMYLSPSDNGALLSAGANNKVSAICRAGDTFYIGFNGSTLGPDPPYSFTLSIEAPTWSDLGEPNGANDHDFDHAYGPLFLNATYRATADNSSDPFDFYAYNGGSFQDGIAYDAVMTYDQTTEIHYWAFRVDETVIWYVNTPNSPKYFTWTWSTADMGNMMYFVVWVQQPVKHYYTFTISPSSKRAPL
jgi:hypothetical protein